MAHEPNDDELDQNWVTESVPMDVDDEDVVSLGSEDEVSDDESVELVAESDKVQLNENSKRLREDDFTAKKDQKSPKNRKKIKPFHKMTKEEHLAALLDAYKQYHCKGELSDLEALKLPTVESMFKVDDFGKHTLTSLTRYIRFMVPSWKKDFKDKNANKTKSPVVLIICSSALRAVEILKHLSEFRCHVAKLFARHMKVHEQVEMLKLFHPIAVGTPNRLKKLIQVNGLNIENTTHVILDMNRDSKTYTVLELNDTRKDLLELFHSHFMPRMSKGQLKVGLY